MTDDLLAQFLIEAPELVQRASEDLISLERSPRSVELLEDAFRAVHTLKGSADLFNFAPMSRVLHAAEDALSRVRDGRQAVEHALIGAVLSAVNETERWIGAIAVTGVMPSGQEAVADRHIRALAADSEIGEPEGCAAAENDETWVDDLIRRAGPGLAATSEALVAVRYAPLEGSYFTGDDPISIAKTTPEIRAFFVGLLEPPALDRYDPFSCNLTIEILSAAPLDAVRAVFRFMPDQARFTIVGGAAGDSGAGMADARSQAPADQLIRISSAGVDRLATLVDDLVVAKNTIAELAGRTASDRDYGKLLEGLNSRRTELDRLVGQLHELVVGLRLVPLGPSLRRLPRLVRELASGLGKSVDVTIDDNGVTADKSVVDGLFEPLVHILRNAVDHGVEPENVRLEKGKPAHGAIRLSARRVANQLILDVEDDGRGVDPAAIRQAVERRGLMSSAGLAALDDQATIDLIFMPGFSTASEVTAVSGRGVGMDAVRASVAKLGGVVSISSPVGAGAAVRLYAAGEHRDDEDSCRRERRRALRRAARMRH